MYRKELKLLISGDQVLPRISSNVSVFPTEPEADPLGDWLASVAYVRNQVPYDVLVLPSHNEPFRGPHARPRQLASGHEKALERLRRALDEPKRAVDVYGALFKQSVGSNPQQLGLATGESLAHINYLLRRAEATVASHSDGAIRYRAG